MGLREKYAKEGGSTEYVNIVRKCTITDAVFCIALSVKNKYPNSNKKFGS